MVQNIGNTSPGIALVISKEAFRNTFEIGPQAAIADNFHAIGRAYKAFCAKMDTLMTANYGAQYLGTSTCLTAKESSVEMNRLYPYGDKPDRATYFGAIYTAAEELGFTINCK